MTTRRREIDFKTSVVDITVWMCMRTNNPANTSILKLYKIFYGRLSLLVYVLVSLRLFASIFLFAAIALYMRYDDKTNDQIYPLRPHRFACWYRGFRQTYIYEHACVHTYININIHAYVRTFTYTIFYIRHIHTRRRSQLNDF